jgi:hypothetical protein
LSSQTIDDHPAAAPMPADTPTGLDRTGFIAKHLHNDPGLEY